MHLCATVGSLNELTYCWNHLQSQGLLRPNRRRLQRHSLLPHPSQNPLLPGPPRLAGQHLYRWRYHQIRTVFIIMLAL